jgi:tryptophan halogenase
MIMKQIQRIVIVGGGTAGWMTAAALSIHLRGRYAIELVESEEIGTVGVGEATIPAIQRFNALAGIDENEFLRATGGTFKLGIEFVNWGRMGQRYMHGFGPFGQDLLSVPFEHYWLRQRGQPGHQALRAYSINQSAAYAHKFLPKQTQIEASPLNDIAHAYHFDAGLYAKYLRGLAEKRGVRRTEGKVVQVSQRPQDGHVDAVVMESGLRIEGDFFVDCSGFRGLLIEQALHTGYEDWSHWLPCNRALAVPCEGVSPLLPYTRSTAHQAGWQWRIPLQHRTGNGHVYCSEFISDDEAARVLMSNLDGRALAEPRPLRFVTGMRRQAWNQNVVAIGLASGFLEPLESTSIHLVQTAIARLLDFFPDAGFSQADVQEYNRQARFEFERIRDFIILHYKLNQRDDSEFWRYCAAMPIPPSLQEKIDLFRSRGRVVRIDNELFSEVAWFQVMIGQNLQPEGHAALADLLPPAQAAELLANVQEVIAQCVSLMPTHEDYIRKHCAAPAMP